MRTLLSILAATTVLLISPVEVHAQNLSAAVRVGTLGPGVELAGSITNKFNLRAGASLFSYSRSDELSDLDVRVQADSDVKLGSAHLLADFYPVRRGLRLTAGLVYNNNQIDAAIVPLESYTLDDKEFAPEKIGTLNATISHGSSLNPYAGIGFGNTVRPGKKLGFIFDLGVLYTGSPSVEMAGTGMIAPTATEAEELEQNLEGISLYPLVSIGLSYKFVSSAP